MTALANPPLTLYVHFPWCVRKCPYCDFNSYTLEGELPQAAYLKRLLRDLESQAMEVQGREVLSIFLGGGTPSLFPPEAIGALLGAADRHLTLAEDLEVTLEANPGAIERGAFCEYRAAGVTRVSLGAQSFDEKILSVLGRIHTPGETRRAAEELHRAGLGNFNLDLMYALPGQDLAGALADLEAALALAPAHLSHYQLTIEPGTVFAARRPALPDEDVAWAMLGGCAGRLAEAGFAQYEVSAYARQGRKCRHNLNYWRFGDYLGIGAGAHGKLTLPGTAQIVRTMRPREPRRYLACADGELARRVVPRHERAFEFMLNALRLTEGFEAATFPERTGLEWEEIEAPMRAALERGLLVRTEKGYRPSPRGVHFLNEMLLGFIAKSPDSPGASQLSTGRRGVPELSPRPLFTAPGRPAGE